MGKKKTEDVDALADFFGGDVDWLLDDEHTSDLETGEELPVAPLPKGDPTVRAVHDDAPDEPAGTVEVAAPPEPPAAGLATIEDPTVSVPGLLGPVDLPTLEVDPDSEEHTAPFASELPKAAPPPPPEIDPAQLRAPPAPPVEVSEEAIAAPEPAQPVEAEPSPTIAEPEPEPAPTPEPAAFEAVVEFEPETEVVSEPETEVVSEPETEVVSEPETEVVPAASALPARARYVPGDESDEWRRAVSLLVAEAAVAPADERAALLFWAARASRRRLGDEAGALELLQDAAVAGYSDARLHRERASTALLEERWPDAELAFADLAASREGVARAEAYQDAAGMAAQRGDAKAAAKWLLAATEADPTDYIAWSLLRDQSAATGDDDTRAAAIDRVAALAPDAVAAEALWERGTLLHGKGDVDGARSEWRRALDRWPSHAPALLSLRASYLEAGDHAGRGGLYEREANRPGQIDSGWWFLKAARAFKEAGNDGRARGLFTAAAALGDPLARREFQGFLAQRGDETGLEEALQDEIRRDKDRQTRAFAAWRLGLLRERTGDRPGARTAYAQAVEIDPTLEPAAEALARLVDEEGGPAGLDALEQRAGAADAAQAGPAWIRVAEAATLLGQPERARAAWSRILAMDPVDGVSLESVVYTADDPDTVAAASARLADHASDPRLAAAWRYLAVTGAPSGAATLLREAALADPDNAVITTVAIRALLAGDDVAGAIDVLEAVARRVTGPRASHAGYHAARLALERAGDPERAQRAVARSIEADARLTPAVALVREIASRRDVSRDRVERARHRASAAEDPAARVWWHVAAALAAQGVEGADPAVDLDAVLADDPLHGGALALRELCALETRDWPALARAWRAAVDSDGVIERRATRLAWLAELLQELGDLDGARWALQELAQHNPGDAPLRGAARIAAAQHDWREAASLLRRAGEAEDLLERARILGHYVGDVPAAMSAWRDLLADPMFGPAAAVGLLQVASGADDVSAARAAHRALSTVGGAAFRAAHLAWSADIEEDAGDLDAALRLHREVLDLRPASRTTFDAIRKILVARRDVAGLIELWTTRHPDDPRGLAEDLEAAGDTRAAIEAWRRASEADLPALLEYERALAGASDWRGVFDALRREQALVREPSSREALEARKRWVLAGKLTASAEAWDVYRALHDEHPADREVEEALARIAAERGEITLAAQLWTELSATAGDPVEAAALRRQVAAVYETDGDSEAARQAYLDALDFLPHDEAAIEGLERLARASGDDRALQTAMERRASLAGPGAQRVSLLRDVARLVEARGDDPAIAAESWRRLLDESPDDIEALERLTSLADASGTWDGFVEHATTLATLLDGPERAALLRRVGIACEDHLGRDPMTAYESAVREDPPDREALRRLHRLLDRRGDEAGVVRCLKLEATFPELTDHERAALLARAATIESTILHEREVAADLWRQVLDLDPEHRDALAWLSSWLYEQGRLEAAGPLFERLEPRMTEGRDLTDFDTRVDISVQRFRHGQLLARAGRVEQAVLRYEGALELNPTHLPSLEAVAPLYEQLHRGDDAERAWRQVLQLIGGTGETDRIALAYARLGHVEAGRGDAEKAFKRFNKALELQPNQIDALRGLARAFEQRQDWDGCMKAWNNVIYHATRREDVIEAYLTKGRLLDDRLGRPDKAAEHYQRCLDVDGTNANALLRLADISLRASDWRAAEAWAHRGLRQDPEPARRADLLVAWALSRHEQGDPEGAKAAVAEATGIWPPLGPLLGADPLSRAADLVRGVHERLG